MYCQNGFFREDVYNTGVFISSVLIVAVFIMAGMNRIAFGSFEFVGLLIQAHFDSNQCFFLHQSKTQTAAQMYDFSTSQWTALASMTTKRSNHGCGTAIKSDQSVVAVVAGGTKAISVEIYDFSFGTWR